MGRQPRLGDEGVMGDKNRPTRRHTKKGLKQPPEKLTIYSTADGSAGVSLSVSGRRRRPFQASVYEYDGSPLEMLAGVPASPARCRSVVVNSPSGAVAAAVGIVMSVLRRDDAAGGKAWACVVEAALGEGWFRSEDDVRAAVHLLQRDPENPKRRALEAPAWCRTARRNPPAKTYPIDDEATVGVMLEAGASTVSTYRVVIYTSTPMERLAGAAPTWLRTLHFTSLADLFFHGPIHLAELLWPNLKGSRWRSPKPWEPCRRSLVRRLTEAALREGWCTDAEEAAEAADGMNQLSPTSEDGRRFEAAFAPILRRVRSGRRRAKM